MPLLILTDISRLENWLLSLSQHLYIYKVKTAHDRKTQKSIHSISNVITNSGDPIQASVLSSGLPSF